MENNKIIIGRRYRHFKGGIYKLNNIGYDSETHTAVAIYTCLQATPGNEINEGKVWVRDLGMFMSEVDHEKYPEVKQKFRFEIMELDVNDE